MCVGNSYVFQNGLYDFIFNQFIEDLQHCAKLYCMMVWPKTWNSSNK